MSELIDDLNWRYATKVFDSEQKVGEDHLHELCEALRLSASSFGLQCWRFVLVGQEELKRELRAHSFNQSQVEDCSHLFILCSPIHVGDEDVDRFLESHCAIRSEKREALEGYAKVIKGFIARMDQKERWNWMDKQIYLALGTLLTCCAVKRIDACPIEGFSPKEYDRILKLKEQGLRSVVVCAVGHRSREDKYGGLPKVRYPMDEVLIDKKH
ncbi:MAG: nitroreductase family protein [Bacteriovoracales bacterium]|nr:nitroreductase family protein [Bacteriovoracales bacterium]